MPPNKPPQKKPTRKTNRVNIGKRVQIGQIGVGENIDQRQIHAQQHIEHAIITPLPAETPRFAIPQPSPVFTGRKSDINRVRKQLASGGSAAISGVTGFGGVGKTELALYVADQLKTKYPYSCKVDLRGSSANPLPPTEIMAHIIRAFSNLVELPTDETDLANLYFGLLRGKGALILLDDASEAWQVDKLLPVEGCAFLITSRTQFHIKGQKPISLDVLTPAQARKLLLKLCKRIGSHADALAKACGYLPLALEIAGSFLAEREHKSVATYLSELRAQRLSRLKRRGDKRYDVEAVFSQTYNNLGVAEQTTWRVLGIFPASFTTEAAGYVLGFVNETADTVEIDSEKTEGALEELQRYSILSWSVGSYELHDLLREYAQSKMSSDEKQIAAKQHAKYYFEVTRVADTLFLQGGENTLLALNLFEGELTNIRAGREWGVIHLETDKSAALLTSRFADAANVMSLRLGPQELVSWFTDGLSGARNLKDRRTEGVHLGNLGLVHRSLGELPKAIEYHSQALTISREIGDRRGEGTDLGNLGLIYSELGDITKAIEYHNQALTISREVVDRRGESNRLNNLGNAYSELGDIPKAIEYFLQAISVAQAIGDHRGEEHALSNLGFAYHELDDIPTAIVYCERGLSIAQTIGDREGEGNALDILGNAYFSAGEIPTAINYCQQALAIAQSIGDRRDEGSRLGSLGNIYLSVGDTSSAINYYLQALAIAQTIRDRKREGRSLSNLGVAYTKLGDKPKAKALWQRALEIFIDIRDPNVVRVQAWLEE